MMPEVFFRAKEALVGNLAKLKGINQAQAGKLAAIGLVNTKQLLQAGATPVGRRRLAESTGINGDQILRWVNMMDLFRIKGIGEDYAQLLEAAGVGTVAELSRRNPQSLQERLAAVNQVRKLVRRLPAGSDVTRWITQAGELPRLVSY
jgi:predicted flap endonuclease-1-like 5' DNA nuclease